jgi:hypothetical protein
MYKTARTIALCSLLSLATQPLFGMQATPAPQKKTGLIALTVGVTALIGTTVSYLLLAKSDKQVRDDFKRETKRKLESRNLILGEFRETPTTVPPLSEMMPSARTHPSHHADTILSNDQDYKVTIQHHITKKYGLHFHELIADYQQATGIDRN